MERQDGEDGSNPQSGSKGIEDDIALSNPNENEKSMDGTESAGISNDGAQNQLVIQ